MMNLHIGFIGIGVMGKSMAMNIMKAGYPVSVYSRTKSKCESLLSEGADWKESPRAIAEEADVIITMVGYPSDVEEIYLGSEGLLKYAKPGTYLIDMTTSAPSLAQKLYAAGKEVGLHVLDAPVSGGDIGAQNANLAIMVGGDQSDFESMMPIFKAMGTNIIHQGDAGSGQHTKLCNQIAIATNMIGVCEAIVYAEKSGLNPETVLKSISTGAAGSFSLTNLAPRILKGDFEPGFYIKHFLKDLKIAIEESERLGLDFPGLTLAKAMYEKLADMGEENRGTQALYKYYTEASNQ